MMKTANGIDDVFQRNAAHGRALGDGWMGGLDTRQKPQTHRGHAGEVTRELLPLLLFNYACYAAADAQMALSILQKNAAAAQNRSEPDSKRRT